MTQTIHDDAKTVLKTAIVGSTRPVTFDVAAAYDLGHNRIDHSGGNFDIRIEDELLRVTAVTVDGGGTGFDRWTASHVTGGAAASGHSAGQEVSVVFTKSGLLQFIADDVASLTADDDSGLVPKSTVTTKGDLIVASGSAAVARLGVGSNGKVLTANSGATNGVDWETPSGWDFKDQTGASGSNGDVLQKSAGQAVWGADPGGGGGGGGASTGDHFVVGMGGQADTDISNRIVIPGLSGSPDVRVGGTNDDEFDQNTSGTPSGWTSFNTPGTVDTNTFKSHLRIKKTSEGGSHHWRGIYKAAPSIPYTVTAKLSDAAIGWNNYVGHAPIVIMDGTSSGKLVMWEIGYSASRLIRVTTWSDWTSFNNTPWGDTTWQFPGPLYVRLVVNAANNIDAYMSTGGMAWVKVASGISYLSNATYVGLAVDAYSQDAEEFVDWIRFS